MLCGSGICLAWTEAECRRGSAEHGTICRYPYRGREYGEEVCGNDNGG